jgi:sugar phosphate isomerase/epimerase
VEIISWTWPAAASDWAAQERERFDEHGVGVSAVGAWGVDPLGDGAAEERALDYAEAVDQCPAGYGDVPWGNIVDLLYLAGYDGTLNIEPHGAYWGHEAPDDRRHQGILRAAETVAGKLLPADRPSAFGYPVC